MNTKKNTNGKATNGKASNGKASNGKATNGHAKSAQGENSGASQEKLQEFFEDGIKDLYWAEKHLTKAIPKMIKNATNEDLIDALTNHLKETEGHVKRLESVFATYDAKPVAKKCEAMEGLVKEAEEIMQETEKGSMKDAGIIAGGQKVEHYEIASYGTLAAYADILGNTKAADLLRQTLEEEKVADEKLTEVTPAAVTLQEVEEEEEA